MLGRDGAPHSAQCSTEVRCTPISARFRHPTTCGDGVAPNSGPRTTPRPSGSSCKCARLTGTRAIKLVFSVWLCVSPACGIGRMPWVSRKARAPSPLPAAAPLVLQGTPAGAVLVVRFLGPRARA